MTTCPTCGAQNDPGNRFCDQCGTRVDAAPAAAPAPAAGLVPPDQPTMTAPSCPSCGATVLPGEAYCENCGADLTAISVAPAPA
ncbi:MAG: zinc-ribbon domain-containing protein, partial [Chloroflexales bacterium]